jgi:hypothetical protein
VGVHVVTGRWKMSVMPEKWRWGRNVENRKYRKSVIKRAADEEIE